jgi:hypothetical protein
MSSIINTIGEILMNNEFITQHTNGSLGGSPIVSLTTESGANTITCSGFPENTHVLNKGDMIYFENVGELDAYAHMCGITKSTGRCMYFKVTDNVISNEMGIAIIPIFPKINSDKSDLYRNVIGDE